MILFHFSKRNFSLIALCLTCLLWSSCEKIDQKNNQKEAPMQAEHRLSHVLDGFHLYSYYAGSISTAAEFVSCGCKKIALSSPFTDEELAVMINIAKIESEKYGIPIYVEQEFLTTQLFDTAITEGKSVIFIAQSQKILDEYFALKKFKQHAIEQGNLADVEDEIAWKFGRLLSYDDETIKRLLQH